MDKKNIRRNNGLILSLPLDCLPQSALVDTLLLAAGVKRVLRTKLLDGADVEKVRQWYESHGLFGATDEDGFVFVGRRPDVVEVSLLLDRSSLAHELPFGLLLGYPACCCQAVAVVGEAEIDRLSRETAAWEFKGDFALIDPSGYAAGEALIAHVPCSSKCVASLQSALKVLSFLCNCNDLPTLSNWKELWQWMDRIRC